MATAQSAAPAESSTEDEQSGENNEPEPMCEANSAEATGGQCS